MGAGYAGKNISHEKSSHANNLLQAFNDYKATLPERERYEIDGTLFEFKRKVKAAAMLSTRRGKDISKSLAKLNDADLESMRQYINKLAAEGKSPAITVEAAFEAETSQEDEASLLSYDEDILGEELDTFDALEGSTQSVGSMEREGNRGGPPPMQVLDLESSQALAEEAVEKDKADNKGSPLQQRSLGRVAVSPVMEEAPQMKATPPGKASMLTDLTTSPASPMIKPKTILLPVGPRAQAHAKQQEAKQVQQQQSPKTEAEAKSSLDHNALSNRIAGWRDALPASPAAASAEKPARAKTTQLDPLDSSYDSDNMPAELNLSSDKRGGGAQAQEDKYMGPGELIDAKNETLMGLQRQKVWSYAKNAQLQREVDVLQQQLQQIEALEQSLSPMDKAHVGSRSSSSSKGGGGNNNSVRGVGGNNEHGPSPDHANARSWAAEQPARRMGGPRTLDGNTNTRRVPRDRDLAPMDRGGEESASSVRGGLQRDGNNGNSGFAAFTNNNSNSGENLHAAPPSHNNRQGGGGGGVGGRRAPRRRPAPAAHNDTHNDSDDSAHSHQHSYQRRNSRSEAWRTENSGNGNSTNIGGGGRNRSDSDIETDGYLQNSSIKKASNYNSGRDSGAHAASVGSDNEVSRDQQNRRHMPRQRPRPEHGIQHPNQPQNAHHGTGGPSPHQSSPSQFEAAASGSGGHYQGHANNANGHSNNNSSAASRIPRGGRRLSHEPAPHKSDNRGGEQKEQSPPSALPPLRAPGAGPAGSPTATSTRDPTSNPSSASKQIQAEKMERAANTDNSDDNSVSSQQDLRRKHGKNVLKNANRRRRHTMEDVAAAGGSREVLQQLPEEKVSDIEYQPSSFLQGHGAQGQASSGPRQGVPPNRRIRQPKTVDQLSSAAPGLDYSEEEFETEETKHAEPPRRQKKQERGHAQAGRRSSAESAKHLQEQKLKMRREEKAAQREDRRRAEKERQAAQDVEDEALFTGHAWTRVLDNGWSEVELLLQRPIEREEDLLYAVAAAEAGMMFTDQLNSAAKSLGVLRGALSRWLLPYDSSTRLDEQCSTPHSVIDNMPDEFRGKLTERQVHYLVAGANSVRKLVRIKIADDNDLEQARQALKTAIEFFKRLQEAAQKESISPFALLEQRIR